MPELPEVESVRRYLKENIIGLKVENIDVRYPNMIKEDISVFKKNLIGKSFKDIKRKGKFLIFELDDIYLVSHLRMEGKYFFELSNSIDNKHIHVIFNLGKYSLYYQDTRKFGIMMTKSKEELFTTKPLIDVSNDPFENIDIDKLYEKLIKLTKPIKEILLDQSFISGIGNIYADEILFETKLNPMEKPINISKDDLKNIIKASRNIFEKSIENGGTTIKSFTSSLNHSGNFQNFLNVHTKDMCKICQSKIEKIRVGGRGTYYCPKCQPLR